MRCLFVCYYYCLLVNGDKYHKKDCAGLEAMTPELARLAAQAMTYDPVNLPTFTTQLQVHLTQLHFKPEGFLWGQIFTFTTTTGPSIGVWTQNISDYSRKQQLTLRAAIYNNKTGYASFKHPPSQHSTRNSYSPCCCPASQCMRECHQPYNWIIIRIISKRRGRRISLPVKWFYSPSRNVCPLVPGLCLWEQAGIPLLLHASTPLLLR